ncbi:hypothetical protein [Bacillus thuringiensis]|uniref:hypothetical protein n=1 Tax=Bacillus thuringiensis TaxID=1428 RepID=UPI0015D49A01|nr:hypothetical protein [Bacillus thuringiensis]
MIYARLRRERPKLTMKDQERFLKVKAETDTRIKELAEKLKAKRKQSKYAY